MDPHHAAHCPPTDPPVLAASWVIVFVLAFGELGVSILVAPPGETTLPIRIYTIIANTPPAQVAALALLQAVVIFVPLAVFGMFVSRQEGR
jgi:ABC-type Fe3+ transport system permease subunit